MYILPHILRWMIGEILRKPMQLQERHPIKMHLYYLSEQEKEEGLQRLQDVAGAELIDDSANYSEADLSEHAAYYRKQLADKADQKQREAEKLFAKGKPIFTYMLLAVNLLLFLLLVMNGGSTSTETLIRLGPNTTLPFWKWGMVANHYLHVSAHWPSSFGHEYACSLLLGNSCGAYLRIVQIHSDLFLAGIGGGLASFAFTENISAGASGALFGLFGALLFLVLCISGYFFRQWG